MARELRLYECAANRDALPHYVFTSFSSYLSALEGVRIGRTYPFNSYRINGGKLTLSTDLQEGGRLSASQCKRVAYIADVEINDGGGIEYADFYYVKRGYTQSAFYVFDIEMDLWASFMPRATFSQVHIKRCNRDFSEGVYDEIKYTKGLLFNFYDIGALNRPINEFCVCFLASVVIQTSFFGSNPLTQNVMLYLPLEGIAAAASSSWANMDIIEKARFIVGGMYKTAAFGASNNLSVLRCWIMPKDCILKGGYGLSSITTKTFVTNNVDYTFNNVFCVRSRQSVQTYNFIDFLGGQASRYPNSAVQFGTRGHAMPLTRFTRDRNVYFRVFAESGEIRAQVEQGNNVMDVSGAFELDINVNNQMGTALQDMAKTFSKVAGIVKSTAKGYEDGGYAGAGFALASSSAAAVSQEKPVAPASNNGDAATTYSLNDANYVMFPLVLAVTPSANDEDENAYFNGANFDTFESDFSSIAAASHLGSVAAAKEREGTYIQADEMNIEGLNSEAENYIKAEFKRGVWLIVL